ncbi:hypothetical protein PoB_006973300 [Plakobranchus ocellatus]|uniref:Uncharacterized protein n=1 Tax=Plakobranchus ocellatus TaxID=259542 RepID=A0AAV4DG68_9GAST|nr:hypothetical protein PoB_006973300 [Plakobranchus ocellatus]
MASLQDSVTFNCIRLVTVLDWTSGNQASTAVPPARYMHAATCPSIDRVRGEEFGYDSDKLEHQPTTALVDVNGNPTHLDLSSYPQMRQSPYSSSSSSPAQTSSGAGQYGGTSVDNLELARRKRNRKLNKQRGVVVLSDGKFKNDTPIEDILDYILGPEGSTSGQGKKQTGKEPMSQDTGKPAVKKKQQGTKKENNHILNGRLSAEEKVPDEDTLNKKAAVTAMGNSVSEQTEEENKTDPSVIEDFEKSNEYLDCLSSVDEETAKSDKAHYEPSDRDNKKDIPQPKENSAKVKAAPKGEESSRRKDIADTSSKVTNSKKSKTKPIAGKKDSTSSETVANGPLSPTLNMVKSSLDSVDKVAGEDTFVRNPMSPDLDSSAKKEEVFVEVKKKKKRTGPKDTSVLLPPVGAPFVPNQYYSRNPNVSTGQVSYKCSAYQRPPPRSSTPPVQPSLSSSSTTTSLASSTISMTYTTNSTTTPIVSSSNTTLSISSNSSNSSSSGVEHHLHPPRDLSPSAFPVLEGHSLPTGTEARRNSFGDATDFQVESKSLGDSDRESVKSLPATSPMYPISYAKMAATSGPRRSNNSSYPESIASPSSDSVLGWQNSSSSSVACTPGSSCHNSSPGGMPMPTLPTPHTPERRPVWKGSPRERRHSIGSSPAEKIGPAAAEDCGDASITNRSRQKSGSQEFLNRDLGSSNAPASTDVAGNVMKVIHTSESSGSLQSDSNLSEEAVVSSSTTASRDVAATSQPSCSTHTADKDTASSPSQDAVTSAPSAPSNKQPAVGLPSVPSQPVSGQKSVGGEVTDGSIKKGSAQALPQNARSGPSSVSRTSTATSNTKSVVFLDKRFTSNPAQSLGITFGFDSTFDSVSGSVSEKEKSLPKKLPESHSNQVNTSLHVTTTASTVSSASSPSFLSASSEQLAGSQQPAKSHNIPTVSSVSVSTVPLTCSGSSPQAGNASVSSDKKVPKDPHIEHPPNGVILPVPKRQQQQLQSRNQPTTNNSIANTNVPSQTNRPTGSKVGPGVPPSKLVIPFSPYYPPPPLPQGHAVAASSGGPPLVIPHKVGEVSGPAPVGCLPDISQPPPVPTINPSTAPQPSMPLPHHQQHHHNRQQELPHKPAAIPVIYGLKIKPEGGCGTMFFTPHLVNPRTRPKEYTDVSNFLKKGKLTAL